MSHPDLQKYKVVEPRLDLQSSSTSAILVGGNSVNYTTQPAQSWSNANWNFTITPPNADSILDRIIMVSVPVTISATGTGNDSTNMLTAGVFALRNKPISAITQQLSLTTNTSTQTISLQDILPAFQRIKQPSEFLKSSGSICPDTADPYMSYGDGTLSSNNPFGSYQNMTPGADPPRGAYPLSVTTNTPTAFNITYNVNETLIIPPLLFSSANSNGEIQEQGGLTNLNNVVVQFTLGNLARIFSYSLPVYPGSIQYGTGAGADPGQFITLGTVQVSFQQPILNVCWISRQANMAVPQTLIYPLQTVNIYRTANQGSVNALGGAIKLVSQTLQWPSIPLKIYIWAQLAASVVYSSDLNMISSSDTFLNIQNISCQFNNRSGLLSAASSLQLYMLSLQNGLSMSWNEWLGYTANINGSEESALETYGTVGSLLVLDPNKDFGLSLDEGISSMGNYQFQVSAMNCINYNQYVPYSQVDLNVVAVFDGYLIANGMFYSTESGVNSKLDVLNAPFHSASYNEIVNVYGGSSFFSTLGNIAGKLNDLVKKSGIVSTLTGALVPGVSGKLAQSAIKGLTGYGEGEMGGRRLTKSSLHRRLK